MAKRTLKRTRTRVKKKSPPTLSPAAMKKRLATRKRTTGLGAAAVDTLRAHRDGGEIRTPAPADDTEDLFAILQQLVRAISLIRTAKRSLEHHESMWDEITTLEAAIKMLRRVDVALNDVADGRPSRMTPDKDEDHDDDEEVNS
jgi:hypothetical protein